MHVFTHVSKMTSFYLTIYPPFERAMLFPILLCIVMAKKCNRKPLKKWARDSEPFLAKHEDSIKKLVRIKDESQCPRKSGENEYAQLRWRRLEKLLEKYPECLKVLELEKTAPGQERLHKRGGRGSGYNRVDSEESEDEENQAQPDSPVISQPDANDVSIQAAANNVPTDGVVATRNVQFSEVKFTVRETMTLVFLMSLFLCGVLYGLFSHLPKSAVANEALKTARDQLRASEMALQLGCKFDLNDECPVSRTEVICPRSSPSGAACYEEKLVDPLLGTCNTNVKWVGELCEGALQNGCLIVQEGLNTTEECIGLDATYKQNLNDKRYKALLAGNSDGIDLTLKVIAFIMGAIWPVFLYELKKSIFQ
eukprot:NODE_45_length_32908_cov_0.790271.p9 type:complete len:367 gc:universal NODE_45_length_32908_cov_0.790271:23572-22472(-)